MGGRCLAHCSRSCYAVTATFPCCSRMMPATTRAMWWMHCGLVAAVLGLSAEQGAIEHSYGFQPDAGIIGVAASSTGCRWHPFHPGHT